MSFILVKPGRMINLDHVVGVEYQPANSGIDEETGEAFSYVATLTITLSSVRAEGIQNLEGKMLGSASVSEKIILYNKEANAVWAFFKNPNAQVYTSNHEPTIERNYQ